MARTAAGCGHPRAQTNAAAPQSCIVIQKMVPWSVQVDDSGITTQPIRITIDAQGLPGDLANGQVIYSEDGVEKKAISVGNLHAGVQTVTIAPGLHTASSSQTFSFTMTRPDGSETSPRAATESIRFNRKALGV
jgi:hypothetical protein